jgi:hypothetical protein
MMENQFGMDEPQWWLNRLIQRMSIQQNIVMSNDAWYEGNHPLPMATASNNDLYRRFQEMSQTNIVGKVVDVASSRLAVTGVRSGDPDMDKHIWELWQRSAMDSEQELLFTGALACGIAYISVWPDPVTGIPTFYPEHPAQVVHLPEPGRPRTVAAALKVFYDELTLMWTAVLYMKDYIYKWNSLAAFNAISNYSAMDVEVIENPFGIIPIIPLRNRPTLTGWYASEMRDAIPIQRRINQTLLNMMVAQESVAFPQRYATGLEIDKDEEGLPVRPFRSSPDALWVAEDPDAKFGQFNESAFDGYLAVLKNDTESIASVTNTPAFNLSSHMMVPPSAEALSAMESSLIKKIRQKQLLFGEALEHAILCALIMEGFDPDDFQDLELIWRDPRVRSDAAVGDYAVKMQAVGVPQEAIWAELGATPQMIDQWREMGMAQSFQNLVAQVGQQQAAGEVNPAAGPVSEKTGGAVDGTPVAQQMADVETKAEDSTEPNEADNASRPGEVPEPGEGAAHEAAESASEEVEEEDSKELKIPLVRVDVPELPQGTPTPYPSFGTGSANINEGFPG